MHSGEREFCFREIPEQCVFFDDKKAKMYLVN